MSQRPSGRALTCFNSSIKPLNYTTQNLTKLNIPSREVNLSMSEQGPHKKGPCQKIILAINKKTSLRGTMSNDYITDDKSWHCLVLYFTQQFA